MSIVLPELPYPKDALSPVISERTLEFHYGKHHQAYLTNLNKLTPDAGLAEASLEDVIQKTANDSSKAGIFNNAAQVWNHTFYWHSMKPGGGGEPRGKIGDKIRESFGSYDSFVADFKAAGIGQFGSGWVWLVLDQNGKISILKTANADLPMAHGKKALLTADVWEHAYYLDFQNRRPDYLSAFLERLVNWEFAESNL